jgi:branched-subunit amino acid aminotransferase/4-amino-4-deoxychorismate lyase
MRISIVIAERSKSSDGKKIDDPDYKLSEIRLSSNNFLLRYPRGAYTAARTVKRNSIMDLQSHIDRTVHSLRLMKFTPPKKNQSEKNQDNNDEKEENEPPQVTKELISYRRIVF